MPVHNSDISDIFRKVADLLDIEGANQFRVRAYRQAAQKVDNLAQNVADMVERGEELTDLPGIGDSIAEKIEEIVNTGGLQQLEEIKERTPEELTTLMNLKGVGPERVKHLHQELSIDTIEDLEEALEKGKVQQLEGFGEKTARKIQQGLEHLEESEERIMYNRAEEYTEPLIGYLRKAPGIQQVKVAGSYRRRKETVGDIDILATCENSEPVMESFVNYEDVEEIISRGETRSSIRLRSGLQVDLRVVAEESYGAALAYFTGSARHNIRIRDRALDRSLKINEYGVFREGEEEAFAGRTEQEVYESVDLPFIPPELREDRGEIEAAEQNALPDLVTMDDLRGDLQMHSTASDGAATIREMAGAAQKLGYEYIAITDHSKRVTVAQGLDADRLARQIDTIDEINEEFDDFRILKSVEVDILEDGTLDLPDDILNRLDLRVCCIHYHHDLPYEQQTSRVLRAMENPYFNILGHPTGREIQKRDPMEMDMEKIMDRAAEYGCCLEVNATPGRLDLNDIHCKMAKERGIQLSISTDAHSTDELKHMKFGVNQARRGWLEADDILNTRPAAELLELVRRD